MPLRMGRPVAQRRRRSGRRAPARGRAALGPRPSDGREARVEWSAIGWHDDEGREHSDSLQMDDDREPTSFAEALALVERERSAPAGDPHDHYAVVRTTWETIEISATPAETTR